MGPLVKICGLTSAEDIQEVAALKPDAMGFVFWPSSKRYIPPEVVAERTQGLPASIVKVGVFVDADPDEIRRVRCVAALDVIQLHGGESSRYREQVPGTVWKAVHLDRMAMEEAVAYPVDALLVDQYSTTSPGGRGLQTDWNRAAALVKMSDKPVWLAGGLTPANVREAIATVRPHGVDVSSGVENEPGKKDLHKVKAFIEACRK